MHNTSNSLVNNKHVFATCPNEYDTALQVSIAQVSCERLLLPKTCVTM